MAEGTAQTISEVVDWVAAKVAPRLEYLVPVDDGAVDRIATERANPTVFPLFVPSAERLSESQHQAPSIAVQLLGGSDALDSARSFNIRLVLTVWSPGRFEGDGFVRSLDGWRELFNGLDVIARAVESAESIAGCAVDLKTGVSYGLMEFDNEIPDLYPYWMGRVDFTLACGIPLNKRFNDML